MLLVPLIFDNVNQSFQKILKIKAYVYRATLANSNKVIKHEKFLLLSYGISTCVL